MLKRIKSSILKESSDSLNETNTTLLPGDKMYINCLETNYKKIYINNGFGYEIFITPNDNLSVTSELRSFLVEDLGIVRVYPMGCVYNDFGVTKEIDIEIDTDLS